MEIARGGLVMTGRRRRSPALLVLTGLFLVLAGLLAGVARDVAVVPAPPHREAAAVDLVLAFYDALNLAISDGDPAGAVALLAADFAATDETGVVTDRAALADALRRAHGRDAGALLVVESAFGDGDLVVVRDHVEGQADPRNLPSGPIDLFRVVNGRIVAHWMVGQSPSTPCGNLVAVPAGDGKRGVTALPAGGDMAPRKRWRVQIPGPITAAPVAIGDVVAVASWDGSLTGLDASTGAQRWRVELGGRIDRPLVAREDAFYAVTSEGIVFAVDAATGAVRWRFVVAPPHNVALQAIGGMLYAIGHANADTPAPVVTVEDDILFVRPDLEADVQAIAAVSGVGCWHATVTGSDVTALAAATGWERWRIPMADAADVMPAVVDGAFVARIGSTLVKIDARTGAVIWSTPLGTATALDAVAAGDLILIVGSDRPGVGATGFVVAGALQAFDAATGEERWTVRPPGGLSAPPAVAGGTVYLGTAGGDLLALDVATGAVRWRFATGDPLGTPLVLGDLIVVASHYGSITAIQPPRN